jgi:23S rRNA-/tRNA-specific pseudouridylate synthase
LVAKTKPAMMDLSRQFVERQIKKTYTAVINGIPFESKESAITATEAKEIGVDVDDNINDPVSQSNEKSDSWQLIDHSLEGKSAVTVWRPLRYVPSLRANENTITMVELKPKTGRYHQLRRHMAWVCGCPLIGDKEYDGGGKWSIFRERGLFLCSNKVVVNHPYYNTEIGRKEYDAMSEEKKSFAGGMIYLSEIENLVKVQASIELPAKFSSFLRWEEERFHKFEADDNEKNDDP